MMKPPGRRSRRTRWIAIALTTLLIATACSSDDDDASPDETPTSEPTPGGESAEEVVAAATGDLGGALQIRLSEGAALAAVAAPVQVVAGDPLTEGELAAIFDRLPEWVVDEADQQDFNRPAETLPPPLVGDTVDQPFPALDADPGITDVPTGPLEVVRFQPEGEVTIAPYLAVTFDQPMVPIGTLEQLEAADVPVVMTPEVPGRWRWIGTRTLRFEVEPGLTDRLPMATEYVIEVPAGTISATGGELATTVRWELATPPVQVQQFFPEGESLPLEPVFFVHFDQVVDAEAVLATVTLAAGGQEQEIRLATQAEIDDDDAVRNAVENALDERWIAFRATQPLPTDTPVEVEIGPGTPSEEGPRTTTEARSFSGRTYAPLRIVEHRCGFGPDDCTPGMPFSITMNNAIDLDAFARSLVQVDPGLPGARINAFGNTIEIWGPTEGRSTYEVTLDATLTDVFGQTLGDDETVSFDVGPARPWLASFPRPFVTLDPMADSPALDVATVNHDSIRVKAYTVEPGDYPEYLRYLDRYWSEEFPPEPDAWPAVFDTEIDIDGDDDAAIETEVDLSAALGETSGQLVVWVEPTRQFTIDDEDYWNNRPTVAWVQHTDLGIDAIVDNDELYTWTTDLTTGEPVGGVELELLGRDTTITTDDDGLARTDLDSGGTTALVATVDGATTMIPSSSFDGWRRSDVRDQARWYTFDDRGIYRPGETVRVKGWIRELTLSGDGQLALISGQPQVSYTVFDPQGNDIASGSEPVNGLGGFNLTFDIPEGANLGPGWIDLVLDGAPGVDFSSFGHQFQIQEFRRPEFEVTTRVESPGPYYTADPATAAVQAEYFAGGPLPDADVDWVVRSALTSYAPPDWEDFTFGIWQPWWIEGFFFDEGRFAGDVFSEEECFDCPFPPDKVERFSGRTDGTGTHYLEMTFEGPEVDQPSTVTAEATVTDINRQAWTDRSELLVHPARIYVGLRTQRTFVDRGDPLDVDAIVTDVDGAVVAGRTISMEAGLLDWQFVDGEWTEVVIDVQTCEVTSADEPVPCSFATETGGTYQITAIVTDDDGQRQRTQLTRWVSGGDTPPVRNVEREPVTIVPDQDEYQPGDTAELLVQAPFSPAFGLLTVSRNGILSTETFTADDGSAVLQVPIEDAHIPNLNLQVDMVGTAPRTADDGSPLPDAPDRPAFATTQLSLPIPPTNRTLAVTATPALSELEPGTTTSLEVAVADASGDPVAGAELAAVVVDEAVLSLTGYELPDPVAAFYQQLFPDQFTDYTRDSIVLRRPESLLAATGGDGAAEFAVEEEAAADAAAPAEARTLAQAAAPDIDVRTDFEALAVYAPDETTGPDGTVTIDVPLPDTLTRYRAMVVAVDGADQFGTGEANITARLPLMVRPSAPRFLNFGDQLELPIVVQNQTDQDLEVGVALQTSNLTLTGDIGQRVTVPANNRVEVRFPAAADQVGTARFRAAAVSDSAADATTISLPVYTPATAEAFATYGVIDDGAVAQPLLAPEGIFPQFGGLELNTSSTALQALTDAVIYLVDYPYESSDGYASRILAVAALRDVLEAFQAEGLPEPGELDAAVARDIDALVALQNDDGGFPFWRHGAESIPYESIQGAHAYVAAREAGYTVPDEALQNALFHLQSIEDRIPADYPDVIRNSLSAYALHVRHLAGDPDPAKARALYERERDDLELDAVAWLWPVLDDPALDAEIERLFLDRATETAGAATFTTDYGESAYLVLHSDRRTDGIVLGALVSERPDSDLIPKVVAGLLGNQVRGRWSNVQENAFILLALNDYFDTFEAQTPDFVARVWLGDLYAAEHEYEGRTTDRNETLVPMTEVVAAGDTDIVVAKDGSGRLYYRLGLRYAPDDLVLAPRDEGFVVDRVYEGVDDPDDVRLDPDGTWRIEPGATVRVRLTMVAESRRTHVALVDPLPAGLEPLNPALAVSAELPPDPESREIGWCWCWPWYEHQNLRDDRTEAFTSYLPAGTYEYTYVARATTPGTFVVPPTRAEEIYAPEVFGRSASTTVVVG